MRESSIGAMPTHLGWDMQFVEWLFLFFFTGLLLNHQWKFAEFWDSRQQSSSEREIIAPAAGSDLAQAREGMRQLGLRGEIEWTVTRSDASRLDFRVNRPVTSSKSRPIWTAAELL